MPQILNDLERYGLQYVRDKGEAGATRVALIEDFEEIGEKVWNDLTVLGFISEDREGRVRLTATGTAALDGV